MTDLARTLDAVAAALAEGGGPAPDSPARAVWAGGLRCRVDGPSCSAETDMPAVAGGGGEAPTPGWYLRAALASCDATTIAIEAARAGVPLARLEVSAESDSDARGLFGVADVPAGPVAVRLRVVVEAEGEVGEDELRELVSRALSRSPVGGALGRAMEVSEEIVVLPGS